MCFRLLMTHLLLCAVAAAFLEPEKFRGAFIPVFDEVLTCDQMVATFTEVTGIKARCEAACDASALAANPILITQQVACERMHACVADPVSIMYTTRLMVNVGCDGQDWQGQLVKWAAGALSCCATVRSSAGISPTHRAGITCSPRRTWWPRGSRSRW